MNGCVEIYVHGSCRGNPGPGGWAAILRYGGRQREITGGLKSTTNNQAELTAAINGLKALTRSCRVRIYSNSEYLVIGATYRIDNIRRNGFDNANGELWYELDRAMEAHDIEWIRYKSGHGNAISTLAEALSKGAVSKAANIPPPKADMVRRSQYGKSLALRF